MPSSQKASPWLVTPRPDRHPRQTPHEAPVARARRAARRPDGRGLHADKPRTRRLERPADTRDHAAGSSRQEPCGQRSTIGPSTSYVPITDPRLRLIREIKVGSCFNENVGADGVGHGYLIVPCTGSHELEMYGRGEIEPRCVRVPDADGLAAEGDRNCRPLFAEYVGLDYNQSQYTFWSYYPHPDDWPDDRPFHRPRERLKDPSRWRLGQDSRQ